MFECVMVGFAVCVVAIMIGSLTIAIRLEKESKKALDIARKSASVFAY